LIQIRSVKSPVKSGAGMQDAARNFPAPLCGRQVWMRLAQAGVHQSP